MKKEIFVYRLIRRGKFEELPHDLFRQIISCDESKPCPALAGKMIQLAVIRMARGAAGRKKVGAIEFRRCKLLSDGFLDPAFRERRKQLKAELASLEPKSVRPPNVVHATREFKERRFRNEFSWTPTVSIIQELSNLVEEKSAGSLLARDVMHQILDLTATA
jgi:hypothetical protein